MPRIRNAKSTRVVKTDSNSSKLPNSSTRRGEPLQNLNAEARNHPADETILGPKRRVRAPKGTSAKDSGYGVVCDSPDPFPKATEAPSSPLPPSSPLFVSPSSHTANFLPVATSEDAPFEEREINVPYDQEELEVAEELDFDSEVYRLEEEDEGAKLNFDFSPSGSDPFGFFALESKLKAERLQRPPAAKAKVAPIPIITQPLKAPRSPHKQRIGKRPVSSSLESSSAGFQEASLPSSPSPIKSRAARRSSARIAEEDSLPVETTGNRGDDNETEVKRSKTGAKRRKGREAKSSDSPERLAKNLEALLPKRRAKRSSRLDARKAKKESDDDDDTETEKKSKSRTRGKAKAKANGAVEEYIDVDADERVRERQARIEYFKKLEGYKMAKENVYVI